MLMKTKWIKHDFTDLMKDHISKNIRGGSLRCSSDEFGSFRSPSTLRGKSWLLPEQSGRCPLCSPQRKFPLVQHTEGIAAGRWGDAPCPGTPDTQQCPTNPSWGDTLAVLHRSEINWRHLSWWHLLDWMLSRQSVPAHLRFCRLISVFYGNSDESVKELQTDP